MPELVAGRSARRRIPKAAVWNRTAWRSDLREADRSRSSPWFLGACVVFLGMATIARGVGGEGAVTLREEPEWMEMPSRGVEPVSPPPTPPSPPTPSDLPRVHAPIPLERRAEDPPAPDPSFGLDDAVATGELAVAAGGTLAREPDPVVRVPDPPAGPFAVEAVPASVRPVVPIYPPRAEERGLEARVVALVTTDTLGNAIDVRIEASGGREFDQSVRRAIFATRFVLPRDTQGRARSVAFRMPYDFRLQ